MDGAEAVRSPRFDPDRYDRLLVPCLDRSPRRRIDVTIGVSGGAAMERAKGRLAVFPIGLPMSDHCEMNWTFGWLRWDPGAPESRL
jgi:hypothetical protein